MSARPAQTLWIVDDSPLEAKTAADALADELVVEVFPDGPSMLERLAVEDGPDVLMLDWMLPGMTGVEICRFVRTTRDEVSLPILLLTSRQDSADVVEGLTAGANDYLPKPYVPAVLIARVKTLARTRRLHQLRVAAEAAAEAERGKLRDAMDALRLSEERQRRALDASGAGLWELEASTGNIDADRQMVKLMGLPDGSKFTLASGLATLPDEDRARVSSAVNAALAGENGGRYLTEFRTGGQGDVPQRWVESRANVIFDAGGVAERLAGAMIDVTSRKHAELQRTALLDALAAQPLLRVSVLRGPNLVYEMANAAHLEQVAQGRDVLGRPLLDVLPEMRGQGFDVLLHQVMETGVPYVSRESATDVFAADGAHERRYVTFVYQPIRGQAGRFDSVLVVSHDVTELVRSRESAQRLAMERQAAYEVLEHGDPVVMVDAKWRFTFANVAWQKLVQLTREDVIGKDHWRVFPTMADPQHKYFDAYHRAMRERVPVHFTEYYAPLDIWTAVSAYPTADGGLALFLRDVTQDRRIEEEARGRADFERQLIGIVSHDLRNPLSNILLGIRLLMADDGMSGKSLRFLLRMQSSAERGSRMVRDLLDFTQARLGGGIPVVFSEGNLHTVVREVVEEARTTTPDREVRVVTSGAGEGNWDIERLSQVVLNLVGNALKYSPPASVVEVKSDGDSDGVTISVHNTGEPIPAEALARIFQPLQRATSQLENTARSVGLGLFIVKHLVEAHEGRITVTSTREDGTTFGFWVPKKRMSAGVARQAGS